MVRKKKVDPFVELGTTGLRETGGRVLDEFLSNLKGRRAAQTYEEMSKNSSTVGALLFITESLARQCSWTIEPSGDSPEQQEWAEFVRSALFEDMEMTWPELLTEILTMFVFGWSYHEIVYKQRKGLNSKDKRFKSRFNDGKIGWRKIEGRAQQSLERWEITDDGTILGMWQNDFYNKSLNNFIPAEKALLFRTKRIRNNPEGVSILRTALTDYFYLKRIQEIEAIGIERELAGLPLATMPVEYFKAGPDTDQARVKKHMEDMLATIRSDERAYILFPPEQDREGKPTGWSFKLVSSGGSRAVDTNNAKNYYKQGIFQSALAQFLQLGMSGGGSHAQVREHISTFGTALGAQLDAIQEIFNRQAIPRLMELNGVDQENWPKLKHGKVEAPSMSELSSYISKLVSTNVIIPDEKLEDHMRDLADLPMRDRETTRETGEIEASNGSSLEDREAQRVEESVVDEDLNREDS